MKVVAELNFVDSREMLRLNRKFRRKDQPTDVLSFPLEDFKPGPDKVIRLGDIVICKTEAKKKGHKIAFLIKHAMLHLLGVHHQ